MTTNKRLLSAEKLKKFLWEKSEDHRNTPEMSYGSSPCDLAMANAYDNVIDEIVSGRLDAQPAEVNAEGLAFCPFCGEPAQESPHPGGNGIKVGCVNDQCSVRPYRYGIAAHRDWIYRDWNTRPTSQWIPEPVKPVVHDGCMADRDGDCSWEGCPQLRDGEPANSGRHCPRDKRDEDE